MKNKLCRFLCSGLLVCGFFLWGSACQDPVAGHDLPLSTPSSAVSFSLKAILPTSLAAWQTKIGWRVRSSFLTQAEGDCAMVSTTRSVTLAGRPLSAAGDWLELVPCVRADSGAWLECGLPSLGWTSAAGLGEQASGPVPVLALDFASGLVARVLAEYERSGGDWTGLNLARLCAEANDRALDSVSADLWRIFRGVADRDISVYDLAPRELVAVFCPAPAGSWLDCRGVICQADRSGQGLLLRLPRGTSWLFRADGAAWLVVTVWQAGDGKPRALAVEHRTG